MTKKVFLDVAWKEHTLYHHLIYSLGTLFSYFCPEIACHMVAEKRLIL
jgi:hypothetical protein